MTEPPPSYETKYPIYPDVNSANQPPPRPATVVYVANVPTLGPKSTVMNCPHCNENIHTKTNYSSGLLTWLISGGCAFLGLICGCCLIPFYMDDCKDVEHYCPKCNGFLGVYKRIG